MLDHQADIAKAQAWLGHASFATTKIYDRQRSRRKDGATFKVSYRPLLLRNIPMDLDPKTPTDALGAMPTTTSASYAHAPVLAAFDRFASRVTRWAGSPTAFCLAFAVVVGWAAAGPVFHFSEDWQLVINTGTTIVTFLMVFLIQQSQNKDSVAVHLKLNELLASSRNASNRLIGIEALSEEDLREVADFYAKLALRAKAQGPRKEAHSIDEEGMPASDPDQGRMPEEPR